MSKPLIIVAKITAKESAKELVKAELLKLIEPSRNDKGCLQYDLHTDNNDPCTFLFYEKWETRELWQEHMNAPHLEAMGKATDGAIENVDVNEMTLA